MKRVGLICDLGFEKHMQFKNYYYALSDLYGAIDIVNSTKELDGIDILFIGDPFYGYHRSICIQEEFINKCNENKITVVVFSPEKMINNTAWPNNIEVLKALEKIEILKLYAYDVDDAITLGVKIHRLAMSRHFKDWVNVDGIRKRNKMVFYGTMYRWRYELIQQLKTCFEIDIYSTSPVTWEDYLRIIAQYRYVLSPLGDANALVTRFYEALLVRSVPIQQVKENTLKYYDIEAKFPDCLFFENKKEAMKKIGGISAERSESEIWLEDYLKQILTEDSLL